MFRYLVALVPVATAFRLSEPAGDAECAFGIRSLSANPEDVTVCCPKYCGECSDYETCKAVNGQDSKNACCASEVRSLVCENNSADPYCLGSCKSKSAPCSLGVVAQIEQAPETSASADCGEAKGDFVEGCKHAVNGVAPDDAEHGGPTQWRDMEQRDMAAAPEASLLEGKPKKGPIKPNLLEGKPKKGKGPKPNLLEGKPKKGKGPKPNM